MAITTLIQHSDDDDNNKSGAKLPHNFGCENEMEYLCGRKRKEMM